ncbi:MAG: CHAT domain-containing protein, partial [bacterium]
QQSLAVAREIGSPKGEGLGLLNIGVIYHYLEQYEKALDCYRQALQLFQDSGQKRGEGIALNNIGLVYADLDSFQIALEYQRRALELDREIGYRRGEGYVFLQMGGIYYELHQFSQALKDYRRALQIAREIGVPEILWEAQKGVGTALENQGREEEALQFYRQSIATIDSMRGQLGLESLKTHFYAEKIPVYACIVELLAKKGRYEEAFGYAEMVKARALLDVLSQGGLNITEGVAGELLTEKDEIQRRLNQINTRLTQEYAKKEEDRNGELIHALQDSLKWARMAAEELARQIELAHPSYAALTGISRPLSLDQIQKKVLTAEGGPVLVEYLVGDENTHVWAVRGNSLNYECIKVKEKELEDMIKKLRQPFLDFQEGKIYLLTNLPYDLRLAHKLYRLIFQPIEGYLGENDPLIIVPDGILHNLPFGSLVTEIREEEVDIQTIFSQYGNAKYLIEKYAISYAPSASVLNPDLQGPPGEGRIDGQLLAFGNPDFGKASQEREEERGFDTSVKVLLRSGQGWVFGQLPKAEEEVVEISEVVGGSASRVFIGKEAKEEIFKEKAAKYRYIHLATHSVLEDREPLYSRIVFALDDDPAEDGFLEAHEIFNLRLNADLVVLSACETGLGELSAGEGLIGLTRAFMYAGAPSVVVSLWTVDGSTCRLMKGFYLNLKNGMTKAEALRQAKIELIGTREEGISYAHPFLWAPFV